MRWRTCGRGLRLAALGIVLGACAESQAGDGAAGLPATGMRLPVEGVPSVPRALLGDTPSAPARVELVSVTTRKAQGAARDRSLLQARTGFLGASELGWLERLRTSEVRSVSKGKGGRSLAFKLELEAGGAAYFKPEQTFSGTAFNAEIVAHALDRALGIGRVPPTVGRVLDWSLLAAAADDDARIAELIFVREGKLRGALIGWIEGELVPARTPPGFENWLRIERFEPWLVTPFQRAIEHGRALTERAERERRGLPNAPFYVTVPEPDHPARAGELSDMLLLDFLLLNIDRWGGGNGNVLTIGEGGPLVLLDNAAGLSVGPHRRSLPDKRFFPVQRFRKRTIDALRALDLAALARALDADAAAPLLNPSLFEGIAVRRKAALDHVDALCRKHGAEAVLSL